MPPHGVGLATFGAPSQSSAVFNLFPPSYGAA